MWVLQFAFLGLIDFLFVLCCGRFHPSFRFQAALSLFRAWLALFIVLDGIAVLSVASLLYVAWLIFFRNHVSSQLLLNVIVFPVAEEVFFRSAVLFGGGSENLTFGVRMLISTMYKKACLSFLFNLFLFGRWFVSAHDFVDFRSRTVRSVVYCLLSNSFGLHASIGAHVLFNLFKLFFGKSRL
jgi:hypothetical protein